MKNLTIESTSGGWCHILSDGKRVALVPDKAVAETFVRCVDACAMLDALVRAEQTIRNLAMSGALGGDSKTIALNEAQNLRDEIARAKAKTE